ncbi:MAG: tRNA (adenosine(37)-N6)-threonylcarbamoyltransferase complex ATPase subunit type 1 TsaE [Alphaproteobacteria bacterium]|nr:tRNA (adenosine(37)-N6)-threonylcarbamoyltransferase complex ATPase subunit type 1 TsaE [Alphaproteobacteria bacterium]
MARRRQATVALPTLVATAALAKALARCVRPGDIIGLSGPLGSGKTTFARFFVSARGGEREEVPSPTFSLVQLYELPGGTIWHFDLFRLSRPEEAYELGIEDAFDEGISVIEWSERLGRLLPDTALVLTFEHISGARHVHLAADDAWSSRLSALIANA